MKVTTELTPNDVYQALKLGFFSSKRKYLHLFFGLLYIFLLFAFDWSLIVSVLWVLFALFFITYPFVFLKYYAHYHFKRTPTMQVSATYDISEKGIRYDSSLSNAEIKWDAYTGFKHNKNVLLLYANREVFNFIPRRFMSDDDWSELMKLADRAFSGKINKNI